MGSPNPLGALLNPTCECSSVTAESNIHTSGVCSMACIAISLAGDRLLDSREQAAVMEILERTMAAALWNTAPM